MAEKGHEDEGAPGAGCPATMIDGETDEFGTKDVDESIATRNNARLRESNTLAGEGDLQIREWHPELLLSVDCPTLFLIGKRRTGKSFFARWLLYHMRERFPFGIIFTETKFNGFWQQYFPSAYIHDVYNPKMCRALMKRQLKLKALAMDGRLPEGLNTEVFILFDDVMGISGETIKHDTVLKQLLTQGRHFNITVIFNMQDIYGLPPVDRNNIDFVFIFKQHQKRNMDAIYENWLSFFESPKLAGRVITQLTKTDVHESEHDDRGRPSIIGKGCMVIDTANDYQQPIDQVYVARADDPGDFLLGCAEFWENSERKPKKPPEMMHQEEITMQNFV